MQVVITVSGSDQNQRRAQRIIERYAWRINTHAWATEITPPILQELYNDLRALIKKRNITVICWDTRGDTESTILWRWENKPLHLKHQKTKGIITPKNNSVANSAIVSPQEDYWEEVKKVALIAGYFHDLGKNNKFFAQKILLSRPLKDPIRHEWISYHFIKALLQAEKLEGNLETILEQAIQQAQNPRLQADDLGAIGYNFIFSVLFCVATHHRLLAEAPGSRWITAQNMVATLNSSPIPPEEVLQLAGTFEAETRKSIIKYITRLKQTTNNAPHKNEDYWRAVTILARSALILADVTISSKNCSTGNCSNNLPALNTAHSGIIKSIPYANTIKSPKGGRKLNQTLRWHLQSVGDQAWKNGAGLAQLTKWTRGISAESQSHIDTPVTHPAFAWQESSAQLISRIKETHDHPFLMIVAVRTGTGKTRACARFAVRAARSSQVRITTLFNLRTLTVQTGRAYQTQLNITPSDLAVIIGEPTRNAKCDKNAMGEKTGLEEVNEDGMERELGTVDLYTEESTAAQWLQEPLQVLTQNDPVLATVLATPILVATADYITPAGDLTQQAKQIVPFWRVWSSDLILDEIDSYDPQSIVALLRLVQIAGMAGRNVIISSATITPVLGAAIERCYWSGIKMFAALHQQKAQFNGVILSDQTAGREFWQVVQEPDTLKNLLTEYYQGAAQNLAATTGYRKAQLTPVVRSPEGFKEAILNAILPLHQKQRIYAPEYEKYFSVGLIRVANIRTAQTISAHLRRQATAQEDTVLYTVCYHAQLLNGQRALIESILDQVLQRDQDEQAVLRLPEVQAIMEREKCSNIVLIVVATPVEEVGRDHDFDWAIIEPSSVQSIIQTAGRVNRHRKKPVVTENVALLQYNMRYCRGAERCFIRPGNELGNTREYYKSHGLDELINWERVGGYLDVRLLIEADHQPFSQADQKGYELLLSDPVARLVAADSFLWSSEFTYRNWPLRTEQQQWQLKWEAGRWRVLSKVGNDYIWEAPIPEVESDLQPLDYSWINITLENITHYCRQNKVPVEWGLSIAVPNYYPDQTPTRMAFTWEGFEIEYRS